jgi:hypothetical protein|tara:strand:+ start:7692 stop:8588 length:897 start_codon:yes stop_codon:yes gene_type:complete
MFGHQFYHSTLRKYVIIFGTLFNEITLTRTDNNGNRVQDIKVPLAYGPRDKTIARLEQDPDLDREAAIVLPRMSFEMIGLSYATERKLNTVRRNVAVHDVNNKDNYRTMYNPVPYDINFELNIFSRYTEDSTKIIEQIMPFFTPEFTITATLIPDMNWTIDIPVVLEAVTISDTYEADYQQRRALIHTLTFTMKGQLFGPVTKSGLIKTANTQFYVDTTTKFANTNPANTVLKSIATSHSNGTQFTLHSRGTITPGLLANGSPTTNASLTVNTSSIQANDNYDYITNFEEFFDGDGTG